MINTKQSYLRLKNPSSHRAIEQANFSMERKHLDVQQVGRNIRRFTIPAIPGYRRLRFDGQS